MSWGARHKSTARPGNPVEDAEHINQHRATTCAASVKRARVSCSLTSSLPGIQLGLAQRAGRAGHLRSERLAEPLPSMASEIRPALVGPARANHNTGLLESTAWKRPWRGARRCHPSDEARCIRQRTGVADGRHCTASAGIPSAHDPRHSRDPQPVPRLQVNIPSGVAVVKSGRPLARWLR